MQKSLICSDGNGPLFVRVRKGGQLVFTKLTEQAVYEIVRKRWKQAEFLLYHRTILEKHSFHHYLEKALMYSRSSGWQGTLIHKQLADMIYAQKKMRVKHLNSCICLITENCIEIILVINFSTFCKILMVSAKFFSSFCRPPPIYGLTTTVNTNKMHNVYYVKY